MTSECSKYENKDIRWTKYEFGDLNEIGYLKIK